MRRPTLRMLLAKPVGFQPQLPFWVAPPTARRKKLLKRIRRKVQGAHSEVAACQLQRRVQRCRFQSGKRRWIPSSGLIGPRNRSRADWEEDGRQRRRLDIYDGRLLQRLVCVL